MKRPLPLICVGEYLLFELRFSRKTLGVETALKINYYLHFDQIFFFKFTWWK